MSFATILARIRGEQPRWEDVASLFELQGMKAKVVNGSSLISESISASYATMFETQITGVETDDLIICIAGVNLSHAQDGGRVQCYIGITDETTTSNSQQPYYRQDGGANALGRGTGPTMMHIATGISGTVTCSVFWRNQFGTGPAYSDRRWMYVLSTKYAGAL